MDSATTTNLSCSVFLQSPALLWAISQQQLTELLIYTLTASTVVQWDTRHFYQFNEIMRLRLTPGWGLIYLFSYYMETKLVSPVLKMWFRVASESHGFYKLQSQNYIIINAEGWSQCSAYNFWTETVAEGTYISFSTYIILMQSNYIGVYVRLAKLAHNLNQCKMLEVVLGSRYKGFL